MFGGPSPRPKLLQNCMRAPCTAEHAVHIFARGADGLGGGVPAYYDLWWVGRRGPVASAAAAASRLAAPARLARLPAGTISIHAPLLRDNLACDNARRLRSRGQDVCQGWPCSSAVVQHGLAGHVAAPPLSMLPVNCWPYAVWHTPHPFAALVSAMQVSDGHNRLRMACRQVLAARLHLHAARHAGQSIRAAHGLLPSGMWQWLRRLMKTKREVCLHTSTSAAKRAGALACCDVRVGQQGAMIHECGRQPRAFWSSESQMWWAARY